MNQPSRSTRKLPLVFAIAIIVLFTVAVFGPQFINTFTAMVISRSREIDLTGEWKISFYNPGLADYGLNTHGSGCLKLTHIKDELWGSLQTEVQGWEYSAKGRQDGKKFVLDSINTQYAERKMIFYGSIDSETTFSGEYQATTGLDIFGISFWQIPTKGQFTALKIQCWQ
ncbi:hypothetical protein HYR54_10605 [Candidatus Acetothermia bacterium]|nr:hypothetical protein [Candidatus Acetothermia bacterium]MBI3659087.1 hypothetical protein [Candidatus Acetothermia bacterium]